MPFNPMRDFFVCDSLPASNSEDNNGPIRIKATAADTAFYECIGKRGTVPVIQLTDGTNRGVTDVFWAYWCPYDQDRFGYTTLGNNADFMFTPTMDGCSFGIGQAGADGSVMVGHINSTRFEKKGDTSDMERNQRVSLEIGLRSGRKKPVIFEPSDYRYRKKAREVSATTFGIREGGRWKFYAHRWVKSYSGFMIRYEWLETVKIK